MPWDVPVTLVDADEACPPSAVRVARLGVALPGIDGPVGVRISTARTPADTSPGRVGRGRGPVLVGIAPLWPGDDIDLGRDTLADVLRTLGTPVPVLAVGTSLQRRVLAALVAVPAGTTVTYAGLAERAGAPGAARAAARVMSTNRVPLVLPCHRIVPAAGGPGAYGWGTAVKAALLALEGAMPGGDRPSVGASGPVSAAGRM